MARLARTLGQALFVGGFMAFIGVFATWPPYQYFPPDKALIKLALVHGAKRKGGCRRLSADEIAKLAPNMRRPTTCPRERLPVVVRLALDGSTVYAASLPPTGLAGDGPSRAYEKFVVDPGRHRLVAELRDSDRTEGYDYTLETTITLAPLQSVVVDFRTEAGGFVLH